MGRLTKPMQAIIIMQEFGWTYEQYLSTPIHILSLILEKMKRDRKKEEMAARQNRG